MTNYPENSFPSFGSSQPYGSTESVPSYIPADESETSVQGAYAASPPEVYIQEQDPYLQYANAYPQQPATPHTAPTSQQNPYMQYQQQASPQPQNQYLQSPYPVVQMNQHSKVAAGLLGIFLGYFGIHNFYLGRTTRGITQLLLTLLSFFMLAPIVAVWAFIEGILILTATPGSQPWGVDANGVPLSN
ncbi:MAG: NINE protein [Propionibacteriaceae bacterium]